jgi:hypothetical protein
VRIIGLCGGQGCGKDHTAEVMEEIHRTSRGEGVRTGFAVVHFAEALKEVVARLFGIAHPDLHTPEGKAKVTDIPWTSLSHNLQQRYSRRKGCLTVREVMQVFGTDVCREAWSADVHVRCLARRVAGLRRLEQAATPRVFDFTVIPDVRFPNEAAWIRKEGGEVWRVVGPSRTVVGAAAPEVPGHASERMSDDIVTEAVIDNPVERSAELFRADTAREMNLFDRRHEIAGPVWK